mgnify:CR=1 FL=1
MIQWAGAEPQENQAFIVCLGFFDGVHLGHQQLLKAASKIKDQTGDRVCVHTYDVPPVSIIAPNKQYAELTPLQEKIPLLLSFGADTVAISHFDEKLMKMTGAEFLDQVLFKEMRVRHLITGFDHRFGFHADTGAKELEELCKQRKIMLTVVPPVKTDDGHTISSTAIREKIISGQLQGVKEMLGREPDSDMINRLQKITINGGGR